MAEKDALKREMSAPVHNYLVSYLAWMLWQVKITMKGKLK